MSVAEGVASAPAVTDLARRLGVETPICEAVRAILAGEIEVDPAIAALLARPLRAEAETQGDLMASFAMICIDKPDALRPAHGQPRGASGLSARPGPAEDIHMAGPFLDEAGAPTGSLILLEAEPTSRPRAPSAAADPYALAGLFASVEIRALAARSCRS